MRNTKRACETSDMSHIALVDGEVTEKEIFRRSGCLSHSYHALLLSEAGKYTC